MPSKHEIVASVNPAHAKKSAVLAIAADELYAKARAGFLEGLPNMEARVRAIDVTKDGAEHEADNCSRALAKVIDLAERMKGTEEEPYKKALEQVRDRWRAIVAKAQEIRALAGGRRLDALAHRREVEERERKKREAALEEARQAEREAAKTKDAQKHQAALADVRTARVAVDELPPAGAPVAILSDAGKSVPTKIWTWEPLPADRAALAFKVEAKADGVYDIVDVGNKIVLATSREGRMAADLIVEALNEACTQVPRRYLTLDRGAITRAVRAGERDIPGVRIFQKEGMAER